MTSEGTMDASALACFLSTQLGFLHSQGVVTPDAIAGAIEALYTEAPTGDHWRAVFNAGLAMQGQLGDAFGAVVDSAVRKLADVNGRSNPS